MKTLLVDNGSKYFDNLKQLLNLYPNNEVVTGQDLTDIDLVVLSGGHPKFISPWERDLILDGQTPVLGICLGLGLIAKTYGGKLKLLDSEEHGLKDIISVTDDPIFNDVTNPISVYESHKYSVSELPPELIELAKFTDGPEIIKHVSKPIYAFQFHPELNPDNPNTFKLFTNTVNQLISYGS